MTAMTASGACRRRAATASCSWPSDEVGRRQPASVSASTITMRFPAAVPTARQRNDAGPTAARMSAMSSEDPYRVLGVDRSWSLADIESQYREQIRESHPDRHADEGPEEMAAAERRTRELTAAMSEVRERHGTFAMPSS